MWVIDWYWNKFLEQIIVKAENLIGYELIRPWAPHIVKGIITLLILLLSYEIYLRIRKFIRSRKFIAESIPVEPPSSETVDKSSEFIQQLESLKAPKQTIERLKKEKKFQQLGEVYVSMQKHKEAGWAFYKAGELKRSATEYAKAGKTYLAAKILLQADEPLQSATLLASIGKHKTAAKWLEKYGFKEEASFYWWEANYKDKAIKIWLEVLQDPKVSMEQKTQMCNKIIQIIYNHGPNTIPDKFKKQLINSLVNHLIFEKRFSLAIDLLVKTGDLASAEKLKALLAPPKN
ncbi:MAG: hypothetical protein N3G21_12515 [Candidatus Hydrogenedentes bacterium]|nr:hypothetical protein [Candidatus Hydrogenedentota bacterium]